MRAGLVGDGRCGQVHRPQRPNSAPPSIRHDGTRTCSRRRVSWLG